MARINRNQLREINQLSTPLAIIIFAILLGILLPRIEYLVLGTSSPLLSIDSAIAILSSIATGMMALTGIVFSLAFVQLQFGSSAYSPRLSSMISRQRVIGVALGVFTGTFIFALFSLFVINPQSSGYVPLITLAAALLWVLASVWVLIRLVQGVSVLTITGVLFMLGNRGRAEIGKLFPPYESATEQNPAAKELQAPELRAPELRAGELAGLNLKSLASIQTVYYRGGPRYLLALDKEHLVKLAAKAGSVLRIENAVGDTVIDGSPLVTQLGGSGPVSENKLRRDIYLGRERTIEQDSKYALRLLVDIAIRALSPALNDPTTAVMALDQIESILLTLGNSSLGTGAVYDKNQKLRLVFPNPTWEDYLSLALEEIRQYGSPSLQVRRRMNALLDMLVRSVPSERLAAVQRYIDQLDSTSQNAFATPEERQEAQTSDRQGLGQSRREE